MSHLRSFRLTSVWIVCASLLMGAFNNCSQVQSAKAGASNEKGGLNYNGSGYSGKIVYAHYALTPLCPMAATSPESEIRMLDGQFELFQNNCSSTSVQLLKLNELFSNPYDPYYLVHNEQIFVNETVKPQTSAGRRSLVHAFCYNSQAAVDFAVRMDSTYVAGIGWNVTTYGHAIFGRGNDSPQVLEIPGKLKEGPNVDPDNKPFVADQGPIRLDFGTPVSPARGPGVLTLEGGNKLPMDCYFLHASGGSN